jgi:hypothetical protein
MEEESGKFVEEYYDNRHRRKCEMGNNLKVDEYIQGLDNPHKDLWEDIRELILNVDPKMEEDIKWGAPTFLYKGNLATFNPRAKKFVNLTFHTGAEINDPDGVLEGDAKEARVFRVTNHEELIEKRAGLEVVVKNWIELRDK